MNILQVFDRIADEQQRQQALVLHDFICSSLAFVQFTYKWGTVCYEQRSVVVYLNIKSPWIEVAFTKGWLMNDPEQLLTGLELKAIRRLRCDLRLPLPFEPLSFFLSQAEALDKQSKHILGR